MILTFKILNSNICEVLEVDCPHSLVDSDEAEERGVR